MQCDGRDSACNVRKHWRTRLALEGERVAKSKMGVLGVFWVEGNQHREDGFLFGYLGIRIFGLEKEAWEAFQMRGDTRISNWNFNRKMF